MKEQLELRRTHKVIKKQKKRKIKYGKERDIIDEKLEGKW